MSVGCITTHNYEPLAKHFALVIGACGRRLDRRLTTRQAQAMKCAVVDCYLPADTTMQVTLEGDRYALAVCWGHDRGDV